MTRALLKQLDDPAAERFVRDWDELEELVIEVYKQDFAAPEVEQIFRGLKTRLHKTYPPLRERLDAYWRVETIQDKALTEDPYALLIEQPAAIYFVGNWAAMQTLPAAREALNNMLLAQIAGQRGGKPLAG